MLAEAPATDGLRPVPLVVDLDGTLVKSDLLYEGYFQSAPSGLSHHSGVFRALLKGKAKLKEFLAEAGSLDYSRLPYDEVVIDLIRRARAEGRPIYLATASHHGHAAAIAAHLELFDGIFASDGETNLSGQEKARVLVAQFGERGFDYVGNGQADIAIWQKSRRAYSIRGGTRVARALDRLGIAAETLAHEPVSWRTWVKAIRVHQYAKNTLIFVPALTAHAFSLHQIRASLLAFLAFSACASSVYIVNDLLDLGADRLHPSKQRRPFASGAIPIAQGVIAALALLLLSAALASAVTVPFMAMLAIYFTLTTAYSFKLKRKLVLDVVVLAMLYTIRVIGGAAAIGVVVSQWLLAFSMFIFLSLALMKRYVELNLRIERGLADPTNRNYKLGDVSVIAALAAASGLNAVTVFSLWIASPEVQTAYSRPLLLWLLCPILIYWLGRALVMAHRLLMDDDPLVFAFRDDVSRIAVISMIAVVLAAI